MAIALQLVNCLTLIFSFSHFQLLSMDIHVALLDFLVFGFFFLTFCNYFAAKFFLPLSSPPHFLSCSPVTLINFWPVDSAWVLLPKCATIAAAVACLHLFCSSFVFIFYWFWFLFLTYFHFPPPFPLLVILLKRKTEMYSISIHQQGSLHFVHNMVFLYLFEVKELNLFLVAVIFELQNFWWHSLPPWMGKCAN